MSTYLTKHITQYVWGEDSVLDLCCGPCNPTKNIKARIKVGIDLNPEVLVEAAKYCIPIRADVGKIGEMLLPQSFDVVLWLDGIEHLEEKPALEALEAAEKIAKKRIVVFTPDQKAFFNLTDEYLRHRSFFPELFWRKRGYATKTGFRSTYEGTTVDLLLAVKEMGNE